MKRTYTTKKNLKIAPNELKTKSFKQTNQYDSLFFTDAPENRICTDDVSDSDLKSQNLTANSRMVAATNCSTIHTNSGQWYKMLHRAIHKTDDMVRNPRQDKRTMYGLNTQMREAFCPRVMK